MLKTKHSTKNCFFVGGAARTGTTLMQSILCSDKTTNPLISEAAPVRFLLETYNKLKLNYERFPGMYFDSIKELNRYYNLMLTNLFNNLSRKYSCKNIVLKEPQLTKFFPLLSVLLEDKVRFICMVRDPRDAISSMIVWGEKMQERGIKHFFQNRDMEELSKFYNEFYIPLFKSNNPEFMNKIKFVKYEDLVTNPRKIINELREFTNLELKEYNPNSNWVKTKLNFSDEKLPIRDAITELYGKPISSSKINSFQKILSEEEIDIIEKKCFLVLRKFGYKKYLDIKIIKL